MSASVKLAMSAAVKILLTVIFLWFALISTVFAQPKSSSDAEQIRALIERISREGRLTDDPEAGPEAIKELEKAATAAREPARSILRNLTATALLQYLRHNLPTIYGRSTIVGVKKEDIATWSLADFREKITAEYRASLSEEDLLRNVRVADYEPIILAGNVRYLRPTLFDVLCHKALEYFTDDELEVDLPAHVFTLDDPVIYADPASFARHVFATTDSSSIHYLALRIFQRLIAIHLGDTRPGALIDVDIERLQFVRSYAIMDNKEGEFDAALSKLTERWPDDPAAAKAWYLQAEDAAGKEDAYPMLLNASRHHDYIKAKAICERVLAVKDSSEGKDDCRDLLESILERKLQATVESANLPGQPFRMHVDWRNLSVMYGRIVHIDNSGGKRMRIRTYWDSNWHKVLHLPVLRSLRQPLPATNDYQSHATEIAIDALPIGEYAVIVSGDSLFRIESEPIGIGYFSVSGIAYINDGRDYFVVDREKGTPLANAEVQVWEQRYDERTYYELFEKEEAYRTDEQGHFLLKADPPDKERNVALEIRTGNDRLFGDPVSHYSYAYSSFASEAMDRKQFEGQNLRTILFTDRSIYRPGQTVYFKGIVYNKDYDSGRPKIVQAFRSTILFKNASNSVLDSLVVVSNDYGSFHGQFHIPESGLTGGFRLAADKGWGEASISVEEYKRPRFYVAFDTLKKSYILGDSAHVTGYAQAFAGNRIDNAVVHYRVIRQVHFFYPCPYCIELRSVGAEWAGYGPYELNEGQELPHGTVRADTAGKFRIDFLATADKRIDRAEYPVFVYTISADVTDETGETHTAMAFPQASYRSLRLRIERALGGHLPADSFKTVVIHATDPGGKEEPALVETAIYALQSPRRLIRERQWPVPDQYVLSKEEFIRMFPHDEYGDDLNPRTWARLQRVFAGSDSAGKTLRITDPADHAWAPGWYLVEARAKGPDGNWVKDSAYFELYNGLTGEPGSPQYLWHASPEENLQPGDSAHVSVGSSAGGIRVIRTADRITRDYTDKLDLTPGIPITNNFELLSLPGKGTSQKNYLITEADRGGLGFFDVFVKDNRVFEQRHIVHVPWTNKELDIQFTSFRDNVVPGSPEKWTIAVKGVEADRGIEVMAGMYDASLDQFRPNDWSFPTYPSYDGRYPAMGFINQNCFENETTSERYFYEAKRPYYHKKYDDLATPMLSKAANRGVGAFGYDLPKAVAPLHPSYPHAIQIPDLKYDPDGSKGLMRDTLIVENQPQAPKPPIPLQEAVRKDFRETAFFYPELHTDSTGAVQVSFTMPEALTTWKAMVFAHSRDLAFGYAEKTVVTQKELMVEPNAPRFLREGDKIVFPAKVINLTDSALSGRVRLRLSDAATGQSADSGFSNLQPEQPFKVGARQSVVVSFPLEAPEGFPHPVTYRVTAQTGNHADGEENVLPLLSNRSLVTESLSLDMPGAGTRRVSFDNLLVSGNSKTLNHHALTLELTSNPAWLAVQALPYLMEPSNECSEQLYDRFYANALATKLVQGSQEIRRVLMLWQTQDTAAMVSPLEKDQELKSILLQETPWLLEAKTETEQKKKLALLLDERRMSGEMERAFYRLSKLQSADGAFTWFKGGPDDRYMTQTILAGIGKLKLSKAIPQSLTDQIDLLVKAALAYLDGQMNKDYLWAKKHPSLKVDEVTVQYLYMRSVLFATGYSIPGACRQEIQYFEKRLKSEWFQYRPYLQGMIALASFRLADTETSQRILHSLEQRAIQTPEKGMYWPGMEGGYYWYEAPIETEALLIDAFGEIDPHGSYIEKMKTWLLRQRETNHWPTTRATAEACYALLSKPGWEHVKRTVTVSLGDSVVRPDTAEAGTGYYKKVFDGRAVQPAMGNIMETVTGERAYTPVWGAVYWQYFEQTDKVPEAGDPKAALRLSKQLFIRRNTDRGPILEPMKDSGTVMQGDEVVVRMEIRVDRDLEYVHLKDMRAACLEPEQVLSDYYWQDGLGYYQSTRDVSTEFFFDVLPKGIYVFEYPLRAVQRGNFSNGMATIECLYAPQFSWHTQGIRINVQ